MLLVNKKEVSGLESIVSGDVDSLLFNLKRLTPALFSKRQYRFLRKTIRNIQALFNGRYPGYKACNTQYHDLGHTLSAAKASVVLLDGLHLSGHSLDNRSALCTVLATLFHDVGYIQEEKDSQGTGAKFTLNHVSRSVEFVNEHHKDFKVESALVPSICRLIQCTGLSISLSEIEFESQDEKSAGLILGTADLLGQMADRKYLENLLFLYYEFREAGIGGYNTEFDILRNTLSFYNMAQSRLEDEYQGIYNKGIFHFKERHGINSNCYIDSIENNINYLKKILGDDKENFRHKLRRGKWIHEIDESNYSTIPKEA